MRNPFSPLSTHASRTRTSCTCAFPHRPSRTNLFRSDLGDCPTQILCWTPLCPWIPGKRSLSAVFRGHSKPVRTSFFSFVLPNAWRKTRVKSYSHSKTTFFLVELAMIMDRLYGGVCYAGIDTDPELKYPKGAGRVAFSNQQSYIAAISARFVQLQHGEIDKRVRETRH